VIGTRFELGMSWLVPALRPLERAEPSRHLHLYFGDTVDLLPRLMQGEIDAVVTSARLTAPGIELARLHQEEYALVGAEKLLSGRSLTRAEDASRHVLLDIRSDLPLFRYFLDARPADESWSFGRVQHLGSIGPIRAHTLEGAGVAVLPLYFVRTDIRSGRLRRLFASTKLPSDWFRLVWRKGDRRAPELRALAAELSKMPLR
jgi:DNA-binding transcriptional LysR family regulator